MEIKIIISDTGAAAEAQVSSQPQLSGQQGTADRSAAMAGGAMGAGMSTGESPAAGPPPEVLRQAAALGASNGGPAPSNLSAGQQGALGPGQQGAPQPFIAARAAELFGGVAGGSATHESAGAAPRSQPPIDSQGTDDGGAS